MYLSYTTFKDGSLTEVRNIHEAFGREADQLLLAFRIAKGLEPQEGDVIAGCRIDGIGYGEQIPPTTGLSLFTPVRGPK